MIIEVTVLVGVNWCDDDLGPPAAGDPLECRLIESVKEAVQDALDRGADAGFTHDMEALVALDPVTVSDARIVSPSPDP